MSWDVSFFAAEQPPPPVGEIACDWLGVPLGSSVEVRSMISESLPGVDWSDPTWGVFRGDGFTFEFNMGRDDPCADFMVHVRGDGDPVAPLVRLARRWGWYVLDVSQVEWWHHSTDQQAGWEGFQEFRDQAVGNWDRPVARLTRQIEEAFALTPYPGDRFEQISATDQDEGIVDYFRGKSWRGHAVIDLRHHEAALSFFTDDAFRYWLPAFLLASLEDPETADVIPEGIAFHMQRGKRTGSFTADELRVIAAFLRHFDDRYGSKTFRSAAARVEQAVGQAS